MMALNRQMLKKSLTVARREMSSLNVVVSSVQLAELKKESNKKVLYFSTAYHPMCKLINPFMKEMSVAHPDVSFIKIDKETFPEAAALYEVKMVPYFVFIAGDKVIAKYNELGEHIQYNLKKQVAVLEAL